MSKFSYKIGLVLKIQVIYGKDALSWARVKVWSYTFWRKQEVPVLN